MSRFAGVVVVHADRVLLVQEPDYFTREPYWTYPAGLVEDGESPADGAARELAEETGCAVAPEALELVSVARVSYGGVVLSESWNYSATTDDAALAPADPSGLVIDARWFDHDQAIELISQSSHAPKREPALTFLRSGVRGMEWEFELIDQDARIPSFRWDPPS